MCNLNYHYNYSYRSHSNYFIPEESSKNLQLLFYSYKFISACSKYGVVGHIDFTQADFFPGTDDDCANIWMAVE